MVVGVFCSRSDQFNSICTIQLKNTYTTPLKSMHIQLLFCLLCLHLLSPFEVTVFQTQTQAFLWGWPTFPFSSFAKHLSILHRSLILILILLFYLQILYFRHVIFLYSKFCSNSWVFIWIPFAKVILCRSARICL